MPVHAAGPGRKAEVAMPDDLKQMMPSTTQPPWAAWVTIVGIVGVAAVGIVAMLHFSTASDAVTVLAPVTGVISALVGAFFGVRSASLAQQKSNEAAVIQAQPSKPPAEEGRGEGRGESEPGGSVTEPGTARGGGRDE